MDTWYNLKKITKIFPCVECLRAITQTKVTNHFDWVSIYIFIIKTSGLSWKILFEHDHWYIKGNSHKEFLIPCQRTIITNEDG